MSSVLHGLTWEDIKDLPETAGRTEIVDGELVLSPAPSSRHQEIATALGALIYPFVKRNRLGRFFSSPVHVILAPRVNYEPDLCFVAAERAELLEGPALVGPPDLAIEILSESNPAHDKVTKLRHYEQYGVREYWIADPQAEHITVYSLDTRGRYEKLGDFAPGQPTSSRILDGLKLDPADVFSP